MTKEQIIDAGIDYTMSTCPVCMGGAAFEEKVRQFNRNASFEAGATWAKEELIKEACKWLKFNTDWDDEWDEMGRNMDYGMIEEFRKAMEAPL